MKRLLITILYLNFLMVSHAQSVVVRHLDSKLIEKDSVNLYYDEQYNLVESQCAEIIRYGHFNISKRQFIGDFKDISRIQPTLTVARGHYGKDGVKDGDYALFYLGGTPEATGRFAKGQYDGEWLFYYPNGKLKERSHFKNGKYEGRYEFFNEDGSPKIDMNFHGEKCEINNAWTDNGKKAVNDGSGHCSIYSNGITWQGKVTKGLPDSVWSFQVSEQVYGNEVFEKGDFIIGYSKANSFEKKYENGSRIKFQPRIAELPEAYSDRFSIFSSKACDGTDYSQLDYYKIQVFDRDVLMLESRKLR